MGKATVLPCVAASFLDLLSWQIEGLRLNVGVEVQLPSPVSL